MSARVGFVGGVLALTALEAVVSSRGASGRVSGALNGVASLIQRISDPEVPAIPDLRLSRTVNPSVNQPKSSTRRHLTTV